MKYLGHLYVYYFISIMAVDKLMNSHEKFMEPHRKPQPGACR
jgi:hypothetical protein